MSNKCTIRDDKFVEPCDVLRDITDSRYSEKKKGVWVAPLSSIHDGTPTRTFYGIRSAKYPKGLAINFCPYCGTQIDAPFKEEFDD